MLLNHYLTNSNLKVTFLRVPSHFEISENEIADNLTKHGFRSVVQCSSNDVQIKRAESKLSYSEVKSFIRDHIYEKWNRHYIAISPVANTNFYSQRSKMYLPFNQKKFLDFKLLIAA